MADRNNPVRSYVAHDGDTVRAVLDVGFGVLIETALRLEGVDAPELSDSRQKSAAMVTLSAVRAWLGAIPAGALWARTTKSDKYGGRWLGTLYNARSPGLTLSDFLVKARLAKPYHGEAKAPWTDAELAAVLKLGEKYGHAATQ